MRQRPSAAAAAADSRVSLSPGPPSEANISPSCWAKCWKHLRLDQTFALPGLVLFVIISAALSSVPLEGAPPRLALSSMSSATSAHMFVGAFILGCLFAMAVAVTGSSFAQRVQALSSALIILAMCAFHFLFVSSGATPFVFIRSIGGSGVQDRPQMPQQQAFWICSTIPIILALGNAVHLERISQRSLGAAVMGMLVAGTVSTYSENFMLWVTMLILSEAQHLYAMASVWVMFTVAAQQSSGTFYSRVIFAVRLLALLSWCSFPALWALGQWNVITPEAEWTAWPVIDIVFKGSIALTLALSSYRQRAMFAQKELDLAVELRVLAQATKDDLSRQFLRWTLHELRVPLQGAVLALEEVIEYMQLRSGELAPDAGAASKSGLAAPHGPRVDAAAAASVEVQQYAAACEASDTAMEAIGAVSQLLDSFLSLAKIEDGRLTLEPFEVPLRSWLTEVTSSFTNALRAKHLVLRLSYGDGVPETIFADGNRLRQVLTNFLSNAIKFSPGGRVAGGEGERADEEVAVTVRVDSVVRLPAVATDAADISISTAGEPARLQLLGRSRGSLGTSRARDSPLGNGTVPFLRVVVSDGGPGIAAEDIPLLFQPYTQIRAGALQKGGGTGLGLALCKKIVELAGGAVGVESKPGAGACFWFEVPCCFEVPCTASAPAVSPPPGAATSASVAPAPAAATDACVAWTDDNTRRTVQHNAANAPALRLSSVKGAPGGPRAAWSQRNTPDSNRPIASPALVDATAATGPLALVRRAVVVDDAYTNRELFARQLRRHGCDVVFSAEDGQDCLAKAAAALSASHTDSAAGVSASLPASTLDALVDVWFVDGVMPVMDGLELIKRLRALGVRAPIVAVTGNALDADRNKFIAAGANAVLAKPVMKLQEQLAAVAGLRLPGSRTAKGAVTSLLSTASESSHAAAATAGAL